MPMYRIVIEHIEKTIVRAKEWKQPRDDADWQYVYFDEEQSVVEKIFEQRLETIDLAAIIKAANAL